MCVCFYLGTGGGGGGLSETHGKTLWSSYSIDEVAIVTNTKTKNSKESQCHWGLSSLIRCYLKCFCGTFKENNAVQCHTRDLWHLRHWLQFSGPPGWGGGASFSLDAFSKIDIIWFDVHRFVKSLFLDLFRNYFCICFGIIVAFVLKLVLDLRCDQAAIILWYSTVGLIFVVHILSTFLMQK